MKKKKMVNVNIAKIKYSKSSSKNIIVNVILNRLLINNNPINLKNARYVLSIFNLMIKRESYNVVMSFIRFVYNNGNKKVKSVLYADLIDYQNFIYPKFILIHSYLWLHCLVFAIVMIYYGEAIFELNLTFCSLSSIDKIFSKINNPIILSFFLIS